MAAVLGRRGGTRPDGAGVTPEVWGGDGCWDPIALSSSGCALARWEHEEVCVGMLWGGWGWHQVMR